MCQGRPGHPEGSPRTKSPGRPPIEKSSLGTISPRPPGPGDPPYPPRRGDVVELKKDCGNLPPIVERADALLDSFLCYMDMWNGVTVLFEKLSMYIWSDEVKVTQEELDSFSELKEMKVQPFLVVLIDGVVAVLARCVDVSAPVLVVEPASKKSRRA